MRGDNVSSAVMGAANRTLSKIVSSYTQRSDQRVGRLRRGRDMEEIEIGVAEIEGEAKPEVMIERMTYKETGVDQVENKM